MTMMTMKMKMNLTRKAVISDNSRYFDTNPMSSYSDFIFGQPTSFLAMPGMRMPPMAATPATGVAQSSTMYGPARPINPVVQVARIHAKQVMIKNVEMAVFGLLCLCACCMMRRPQAKKQFYADSDDEDDSNNTSDTS